jgi:hypothetical protein
MKKMATDNKKFTTVNLILCSDRVSISFPFKITAFPCFYSLHGPSCDTTASPERERERGGRERERENGSFPPRPYSGRSSKSGADKGSVDFKKKLRRFEEKQ